MSIKVTINSAAYKDERARLHDRRAYELSRVVRRQMFDLIKPIATKIKMDEMMRDGSQSYSFQSKLDVHIRAVLGNEGSQYVSHIIPIMKDRLRRLRRSLEYVNPDTLKSQVFTTFAEGSRYHFTRAIEEVRPSARIDTEAGCRTEIISISGGGSSVRIKARVSPAWKRVTERIGFSTLQDRYVVLAVEETFKIDDNVTVHRARVVDMSKLEAAGGYIGTGIVGDSRVSFFAKEIDRAVSITQKRIAGKILARLTE